MAERQGPPIKTEFDRVDCYLTKIVFSGNVYLGRALPGVTNVWDHLQVTSQTFLLLPNNTSMLKQLPDTLLPNDFYAPGDILYCIFCQHVDWKHVDTCEDHGQRMAKGENSAANTL